MSGLVARELTWVVGGRAYRLDPDPLRVEAREVATVHAPAAAGRGLADVLAGLAEPRLGTVVVAGGGVALVPPGGALLPDLTVAANLGLGLRTHSAADLRARVEPAARLLQVDGALALHPGRLSGAQQLRAGMARALATEPAVVVVEDRAGLPSCRPAVAAAAEQVAVLVVTDDPARLGPPPADRLWVAVPL